MTARMFHVEPKTALPAFRLVYVAFIVTASAATLSGAHAGQHGGLHLAVLATIEILAALAFLFRRFEVVACAMLLAVFAIASVMSLVIGEWSLRFLYYAATALFIVLLSRSPSGVAEQG